jgi:hypothetical protein
MALISDSLTVDVITGVSYVVLYGYCWNIGLSNESCVYSEDIANGKSYTISQTCGSSVSFEFQCLDNNKQPIANMSCSMDGRTGITDADGYVTFSYFTGCTLFDIGYSHTFHLKPELTTSLYSTPAITVNTS